MRIGLGTVQLGMPYGVANRLGKPDADEALQIVKSAYTSGMRWFDTAQSYGDSEAVLGQCFREIGVNNEIRVVSKLHPNIGCENPERVEASLYESLKRLNLNWLDGLLLHREELIEDLAGELGSQLLNLKQQGLVRRIGVSCYSAAAAQRALDSDMIELLQLPGNVFDRRLIRDGIVTEAGKGRCTLFVRSVFLQGLALMSPEATPSGIPRAKEAVGALREFCRSHDVDRKVFCLHYALNRFAPGILVIGAERAVQVSEIAHMTAEPALPERLFDEWDMVWPNDIKGLIDPAGWPEVRS